MPAAYFTTPAGTISLVIHQPQTDRFAVVDVVKTRLQVEARKGQTHYKGLFDAFVKICAYTCNTDTADDDDDVGPM